MMFATKERTAPEAPVNFDFRKDQRYRLAVAKLAGLRAKLNDAQQRDSEPARALAAIAREITDLAVKVELGDVSADSLTALRARQQELESERSNQRDMVDRLRAAVSEQQKRIDAVENEIRVELRPQIHAALKAAAEELAPLLRQVAIVNARLYQIVDQTGHNQPIDFFRELMLVDTDRGDIYVTSPFGQSEVSNWFRAARKAGYNVGGGDL